MSENSYLNRTSTWRKRLVRSSFMSHSKYFQLKTPKALKTLDQIVSHALPEKQNRAQSQFHNPKSRGFRKIETELEKNTKRVVNVNKIRLTKNQKEDNPWNLRDSIVITDRPQNKNVSPPKDMVQKNEIELKETKGCLRENFKRIADYNIHHLQEKCPFTRYEIYTLSSTFNAIISDSIAFRGVKLAFNAQRFINDVATMLKVQVDIAKRVFLIETKKKYYAINKSFQFMDFLGFVDQVRKQSLRQKVNDFLNILFDVQKQLSYTGLMALFLNKNNEKDCEDYINKLFSILMKSKSERVRKQELKELFEANEDMLEMFKKVVTF